ncbi:MAG: hypothetical protein ABW089_00110 [Sedimenticola sp.]
MLILLYLIAITVPASDALYWWAFFRGIYRIHALFWCVPGCHFLLAPDIGAPMHLATLISSDRTGNSPVHQVLGLLFAGA